MKLARVLLISSCLGLVLGSVLADEKHHKDNGDSHQSSPRASSGGSSSGRSGSSESRGGSAGRSDRGSSYRDQFRAPQRSGGGEVQRSGPPHGSYYGANHGSGGSPGGGSTSAGSQGGGGWLGRGGSQSNSNRDGGYSRPPASSNSQGGNSQGGNYQGRPLRPTASGNSQGGGYRQGNLNQSTAGGSQGGGWLGRGGSNSGGYQKPVTSGGVSQRPQRSSGQNGAPNWLGRDGRQGRSNYGSNNNISATAAGPRFRIDRAPVNIISGSLANQVRREDHVRLFRDRDRDRYRSGYCFYDQRWNDDFFFYPYYVFDPFGYQCAVSPWYYYPMYPGYISYNRVHCRNVVYSPFYGDSYTWRPYDDRNSSELDLAINTIVRAWENNDERAIERMLPSRGDVDIYIDQQYSYSLTPNDFLDLLRDNITNTRTVRYEIVNVKSTRSGAEIIARHTYEDPWGQQTSVYHRYRLADENGYPVIRDFGISQDW